jgi:hypothetical protein
MSGVDYYYVWPWPPVEVVNDASPWQWVTPVGAFVGTVLLFFGGLIGVYITKEAAARRQKDELDAANTKHTAAMTAAQNQHDEQLSAMRSEGRAERAAERNDRFREEVANLLGERWATENAAYKLATAKDEHNIDVETGVAPNERFKKALDVRNEYTPQLNKVELLAIRASLLTNNVEVSAVLDEIRVVAQMWKDLVDRDPIETFMEIRGRLDTGFAELETLTRKLVTSDGVMI